MLLLLFNVLCTYEKGLVRYACRNLMFYACAQVVSKYGLYMGASSLNIKFNGKEVKYVPYVVGLLSINNNNSGPTFLNIFNEGYSMHAQTVYSCHN